MTVWPTVPFLEALVDQSGGNIKTPQSEYRESGAFPIVDQGKDLVGGYTDDPTSLCRSQPPVLVFGDHTRALKYVDFPFGMGADGVKVLHVRNGFDPKFVFHYLRSLDIPSAGYSRHFKFLKERSVPRPPLEEQRRIAAILDHADALRVKRRETLAHLDDLTQSVFVDMFGDPIENPHGFPIKTLIDWVKPARPITYGILKPGPDHPTGIPYVRVVDMKHGSVQTASIRRTTGTIARQYKRSSLLPGDLLMSIRGHVGRLVLTPESLAGANITQDSARLAVPSESCAYVMAALGSIGLQRWMHRHTKGVAVRGINLGDVKRIPIPDPPMDLQRVLAERLSIARELRRKNLEQATELDRLFASLQSRTFAGGL